jgi:hypothetical protein
MMLVQGTGKEEDTGLHTAACGDGESHLSSGSYIFSFIYVAGVNDAKSLWGPDILCCFGST